MIEQKIAKIKLMMQEARVDFQNYIADQSVPLEKRWAIWADAPSELKDKEDYIVHFNTLPKDYIMFDGQYNVERYQTIKMADVLWYMYENIVHRENEALDEDIDFTIPQLAAFAEEILSLNLESFVYDC